MKIYNQDCLYKLKELKDNSVDSIVTDPPYGLSFMGKKWDYDVPSVDIWIECLRVLKPGGHLLAFAGSRTYHRMAVRIEDAGFEIRDQIMWIYGSGFPKSHNIGKAVDKLQGNEREVVGHNSNHRTLQETNTMCGEPHSGDGTITKGQSQYEGWGTALKPAHEPIVMARKPFKGTVVNNVLEWGTGGINIEESRIPYKSKDDMEIRKNTHRETNKLGDGNFGGGKYSQPVESGRFPSNIILDKEAGKILDKQSGISKSTGGRSGNKEGIWNGRYNGEVRNVNPGLGDVGGASRFFYCPKTSKKDRNEGCDELEEKQSQLKSGGIGRKTSVEKRLKTNGENAPKSKNIHPTVKPTDLMLYLIRLVTPKGGTTLDPFMGSGSTGKAAVRGGFDFIGIEREKEYIEIAKARIKYEQEKQKPDSQQKLF